MTHHSDDIWEELHEREVALYKNFLEEKPECKACPTCRLEHGKTCCYCGKPFRTH